MNEPVIFFEPWALGDAVIAAWALRRSESGSTGGVLVCSARHRPLLEAIFPGISVESVELAYTGRAKRGPFDGIAALLPSKTKAGTVFGIRGDFRDFRAARLLYPSARLRMTGWVAFFARRVALLDFPFRSGLFPTTNRYRRWAKLVGFSADFPETPAIPGSMKRVTIHVGAQWGARRYPHHGELRRMLEERGLTVTVAGGPGDGAERTLRDLELVDQLKNHTDFLIANDSAPMHVSRALGIPTAVLFGNNAADEWLPPGALAITNISQRGYRPRFPYQSDDPFSGNRPWPSPKEIVERLESAGWLSN